MVLLLEETVGKLELIWILVSPTRLPRPHLIHSGFEPFVCNVGWGSGGSSQGFYGPPAHPDLLL